MLEDKKIIVGIMQKKHRDGLSINGTRYTFNEATSVDCDIIDFMYCLPGAEIKVLVNKENFVLGIQVLKMNGGNE